MLGLRTRGSEGVQGAASELPTTFTSPGERNRNQMCRAGEQLGTSRARPRPLPRSLPAPPAAPPGPAPTCLPRDAPAGRPAAGGSEGGLAGRRAAGYPAPDMAQPTWAPLPPRRPGKEAEAAEGAGARGAVDGDPGAPGVPAALRHAGTVLRRRSLRPRAPPGSRDAGGRVLLRAPRFLRSPNPPSGAAGAAAPPRPPSRPAAVTLAAPAQRPAACNTTPGGWEGPSHPRSFSPRGGCRRTLTRRGL